MKYFLFLLVGLATSNGTFAQHWDIDGLKALLPKASTKEEIKILLELCWGYRFINADSARDFGLRALSAAKEAKLEALEAEALNYIGVTHEAQGDYTEALKYELNALELRRKIGDDSETAKTINNIGIIYDEKGDYQKALEYYFEARRIFERMQNPANIAMVISNIGIVLKAQKEYEKVVGIYHEALTIYKKINNRFGVAACDANLGSVYFFLAEYDSALYYSLKSTKEFEEQNAKQFLAMTLCNAGMAFDKLGREVEARSYLERALRLNEEYDNKKELSAVLIYLAGVHRKAGQISSSLDAATRGLSMAEKIGARAQIMEARKELSEIKAAASDFKGAYKEHLKYVDIKDSLFQKEKSEQIAELQLRYETEKKENAIQLLTRENQIKDFHLLRNQFIMISLVILIAVLILLGYLWRNRIKFRQQAELESTRAALKDVQLQAVITSQEAERRRYAADLHDGMGQMISALRLNLSHEPIQKSKVEEAVSLLNEMNMEIREIAFNLMPQVLMTSGLIEALTEFANRINRTGKIQITIQAFDVSPQMKAPQKIALYRICQEWVNNVLKYSGAERIFLQLVQHEEELLLTIEDNGKGFDEALLSHSQGNGWKNIHSRLGLLHGSIEIDSTPGREGTTVMITVPEESSILVA